MKHLIFFFLLLSNTLIAQFTITGTVIDASKGLKLEGVTIQSKSGKVTTTNADGKFNLTLDNQEQIQFSYLGYQPQFVNAVATAEITVSLVPTESILDVVVVSGSQYEKDLTKEAISIEVIKPKFIEKNYITTLEQVMERVPGVQIIDGQVNIRSSGFSQGGGSRVGLFLEGQPMLNATYGSIPWDFVPIENISQIEILKGAASVLYGSAALNGVINVREAMPTSTPYTSVALYSGTSDTPKDKYKKWWNNNINERPGTAGVFFAHRQKWGKFDLVVGGNVHRERGYIENLDEQRSRFNFSTRYRITDKLTVGVRGNTMDQTLPAFFLWEDADTNILKSSDTLIADRFRNYTIDPYIKFIDKFNNKHTLNGRFFNTWFIRNNNDNTPAYVLSGEYNYQRLFKKIDMVTTAGVSYQDIFSRSPAFGAVGNNVPEFNGSITAFYGQVEKNLLQKKLNIVGGVRLERIEIGQDYDGTFPIFRLSSTYKLTDNDVLRGSFGQGYRLPSLVERYVDRLLIRVDNVLPGFEGIRAIPNPNVLPEFGYSSEIGYKRIINIGNWKGYGDVAAFFMSYNNLANNVFDFHVDLGREATLVDILDNPDRFGFSTINIDQGQIGGMEVSSYVNGTIGTLPIRIWGGYTYTYPANVDSLNYYNQNYLTNFFKAFTLSDESITPTILTYRSLHVARLDVEMVLKPITLGFVANFNGYVPNIDPVFEGKGKWGPLLTFLGGGEIIPGVNDWRIENQSGIWVFDARAAFKISKNHQINIIVQNLMNKEYSLRVGRLDPLRTFNLKYQLTF